MTDKLKTASAHNKDLTGRVEMEELKEGKRILELESELSLVHDAKQLMLEKLAALESSLSRAQERLKEIGEMSKKQTQSYPYEHYSECPCWACCIHRLATEDTTTEKQGDKP